MLVASSDKTAFFDCDDTLIMWDDAFSKREHDKVDIRRPYDGSWSAHRIHYRHVRFLEKLKARGYSIIVWSAAGTYWAEAVVKALNLEEYVDFATSKPIKVIDDLKNPVDILGSPFYLSEEGSSI